MKRAKTPLSLPGVKFSEIEAGTGGVEAGCHRFVSAQTFIYRIIITYIFSRAKT